MTTLGEDKEALKDQVCIEESRLETGLCYGRTGTFGPFSAVQSLTL